MNVFFLLVQEPVKKSGKKKKSKNKKAKKESAQSDTISKAKVDSASHIPQVIARPLQSIPVHEAVKYDLFESHELQPKVIKPIIRHSTKQDWFPIVTIFIVFLFSLINVFYQKKFRSFLVSLFKRSNVQGTREDNVFAQRLKILLYCLFTLITASFFYQAGVYYGLKPGKLTGFQFFSVILFLVFFIYLLKLVTVRIMGSIFKVEKENIDYSNNIMLYLNILSFGLFPLVILIGFTPGINVQMLIKTGCVFILAAILFRIGRGYVMAVSNPLLSKFYLFIYLCTLEILPLVVIFKLFVDQFQ